jgi:hypothetical protein
MKQPKKLQVTRNKLLKLNKLRAALLLATAFAGNATLIKAEDATALVNPQSDHWAYQPVTDVAVPRVQDQQWVSTPIDAFILQQIEAKGLQPSPEAGREALARRLGLDVLGLIPSQALVQSFVNDQSPDAYEKFVDTLLSLPQYGERQARKWLDLARYADSSGFQNDNNRLNMWRYRDYVINAFNSNKPYDTFIKEQIAGDELYPGDEQALIATGFMAQFTDNSNSRDMVQRRYQIMTDITDTVGEVVLGQTFECARCHDHKFDAISQADYFSFQSFFANISSVDNIPVTRKTESDLAFEKAQAEYDAATAPIIAKIEAIIDEDREAALIYHKERYLTDTRDSIFKPESEWTALDRWVNHRLADVTRRGALTNYFQERAISTDPEFHSDWHAEKYAEIEKLNDELRQFNKLQPTLEMGSNTISAITELGHADAPPTYTLLGGDHLRPLQEVTPALPPALAGSDAELQIPTLSYSSGRRSALVDWLTSDTNPLTARVYVNRVWDQYFGRGIVESVSNFGKAGTKPSHPELLDYLARRFVESGWDVKQLHRDILLSSVYRQSSAERPEVLEADPQNTLLSVFPRRRLEAEQIRDSLLAVSGNLEAEVGGPSVLPPLPKSARDGGGQYGNQWTESKEEADRNRRSLYTFTRRSLPYPLLEVFNMASPQEAHAKREVTTTPLQALTLINSEIVYDWSRDLAGRVINESGTDENAQFDKLYNILFARAPDAQEVAQLKAFLDSQENLLKERSQSGTQQIALPDNLQQPTLNEFRTSAFVDLVHTVVNANETIYKL